MAIFILKEHIMVVSPLKPMLFIDPPPTPTPEWIEHVVTLPFHRSKTYLFLFSQC